MIHGWGGSFLVNRFPFAGSEIEIKRDGRRLGRMPVVANAVVVVRITGPASEVNLLIFLGSARGNTVPRWPRVRRQLTPLNFRGIVAIDFSHPALVGSNI